MGYEKQKKQTKRNRNRLTDTENKSIVVRGKRGGQTSEHGERDTNF